MENFNKERFYGADNNMLAVYSSESHVFVNTKYTHVTYEDID